ncbi:MAG: hypothetical protein Q4B54_06670 [Coriobacteriales bacterium]|nr:hypothetical protein [Coriobacteriales bacterium]
MRQFRIRYGVALACALVAAILFPSASFADSFNKDIVLGCFYAGDNNPKTTIYGSVNGTTMHALSTQGLYGGSLGGMVDPSIIYKDGYFWRLAGWNRQDGKIWFTISFSNDLQTWSAPEGDQLLSGGSTRGVPVNSLPEGGTGSSFDVVAPEWFVDDDGTVYIVVSCGYYGAFHGEPTQDIMTPYIIKVTELSTGGFSSGSPAPGYYYPDNLVFKAETAQKLTSVASQSNNLIDGSLYKENGVYHLFIKKDGLDTQVYQTTNIMGDNWSLEGDDLVNGYEGASVVNINGKYMMYADRVTDSTADGVRIFSSSSLASGYSMADYRFIAENGGVPSVRHGSVILLKAGTEGWTIAKNLMVKAGLIRETASGTTAMYRCYNPNSGEHFYTANIVERDNIVAAGWKNEGLGWVAPTSSSIAVYRLYNANGGDHHYTTSAGERDLLVNAGWRNEGIGWYSDAANTTPIYRAYNPNAKTGAHNFTSSAGENMMLISAGWRNEGIAWYGCGA